MYKQLKLCSFRKVLPRCIASLVLAGILFAVTGFGVFALIGGPRDISSVPSGEMDGSFVSFDINRVVSAFASAGSSSAPSTEYFILDLGDGKYMSLESGSKYFRILENAANQSEDYYMNDSGILNKLGTYSGQVVPLDDELYDFLTDWIDEVGVLITDGTPAAERTLHLSVDFQRVNGMSFTAIWILSAAALALILYAAAEIVMVFTGAYCSSVKKAISASGDTDESAIDADFDSAPVFGHIRVGRRFIWYFKGTSARAVATPDVIWAFKQLDTRLLGRYPNILSVYLTDRSSIELGTHTPEEREQICKVIAGYGHPFVEGYTQQRAQLFAHDFAQFRALAAKASKPNG